MGLVRKGWPLFSAGLGFRSDTERIAKNIRLTNAATREQNKIAKKHTTVVKSQNKFLNRGA